MKGTSYLIFSFSPSDVSYCTVLSNQLLQNQNLMQMQVQSVQAKEVHTIHLAQVQLCSWCLIHWYNLQQTQYLTQTPTVTSTKRGQKSIHHHSKRSVILIKVFCVACTHTIGSNIQGSWAPTLLSMNLSNILLLQTLQVCVQFNKQTDNQFLVKYWPILSYSMLQQICRTSPTTLHETFY